MSFDFTPHQPHRWAPRRYQPIITRESAYAVLHDHAFDEWSVCTRFHRGGNELTAWIGLVGYSDLKSHGALVRSVNSVKRAYSANHRSGGKFRINEFGQVIVPTEAGGIDAAWCVGRVTGCLDFKDPETGRLFDLRATGYTVGERWGKPLIGLRYTVRTDGSITFESQFEADSRERLVLRSPPGGLLAAGRAIRSGGGYRLIVNDQLVALALSEAGDSAFFIGQVSRPTWFAEEPCP